MLSLRIRMLRTERIVCVFHVYPPGPGKQMRIKGRKDLSSSVRLSGYSFPVRDAARPRGQL